MNEIVFLGYLIDAFEVRPSPENIRSVSQFPVPSNYKTVHSFLGMCSYFRRFLENFAVTAKPLYDLLKAENAGKDFVFGEREFSCFENIKKIL